MILSYHATVRPSVRRLVLSFLVHHNPFYLLSALCMLVACFVLNSALAPRTGELPKLLVLIGTLNLYEAILIGLGVYLIRRGISRDGRTLLILEAAFLLDLTFLNAEAASVSLGTGLLLSLLFIGLAMMKNAVILRALWRVVPRSILGLIVLQIAIAVLLPIYFKWAEHRGDVTVGYFYAAWWVVGGLLAIQVWLGRAWGDENATQTLVRRLYTLLPLASIAVHLGMLQWVYRAHFTAGELSPLLIGVAIAMGRLNLSARPDLRLARNVLPAVALVLALVDPPAVHVYLPGSAILAPARLTFAAAYVAWIYILFLRYARQMLAGGVIAAATCTFGPDLQQVRIVAGSACDWALAVLGQLVPKTAIQWGLVAMGSAFAFLAVGAAVSMKHQSGTDREQENPACIAPPSVAESTVTH